MIHDPLNLLEKYFKTYGWKYKVVDHNRIISGWECNNKNHVIQVEIFDTFLQFQVNLLNLSSHLKNRNLFQILQIISRLNRSCRMVKITCEENYLINEKGDYEHMTFQFSCNEYFSLSQNVLDELEN